MRDKLLQQARRHFFSMDEFSPDLSPLRIQRRFHCDSQSKHGVAHRQQRQKSTQAFLRTRHSPPRSPTSHHNSDAHQASRMIRKTKKLGHEPELSFRRTHRSYLQRELRANPAGLYFTLRCSADSLPRLATISYSTCWPSLSVLSPARSTAEM